ncbi:hypothetical protein M8C21_006798 [Ambrosia artemisiifolia]|uniref:Uncharacterized protein n=1 Tax=Ambrosia artemisiifolia TaxID=4212 RepID=A0AAD5CVJ3_AMBAR|nr:hypothetical protein M8C21_006798 [Ambrosia artemisiifolia]
MRASTSTLLHTEFWLVPTDLKGEGWWWWRVKGGGGRICHEAEFESSKSMESPCSCSGTVKEFEPGYSSPLKLIQNQSVVGLEVPEIEVSSGIVVQQERTAEPEYPQCSSTTANTSASICRSLGLTVTLLLLVRHLFVLLIEGTRDYPFTLLTLLVMRASGIVIPMYIIMRTVDALHKTITRRYQVPEDGSQRHAV